LVAVYIISGIIFLFLLFLLVKVSVVISYVNDLQVKLKILFLTFTLYPAKIKEKAEKVTPEEKKQIKEKKQKQPKPKPPIKDTLLLVKDIIEQLTGKFGRFIKLEEYKVKVLIATDEPAKTGILYGLASAIVGSISVFVDAIKRRTHRKDRIYSEVKADFLAEEPEIFIKAALSLRVWQMSSMGITASKGFLKYLSLQKERKI
jgi:hypothetical protein